MVGWIQQFKKPSIVTCSKGQNPALTFPNEQDSNGKTEASSGAPAGCDVSKNYEQLTFGKCSQTEPDATNKFHMEPEAATDSKKIKINNDGYFKIEFTTLLTSTDGKITRVEVYKSTSKDPTNSCSTITTACTTLIQIRFQTKFGISPNTGDKTGQGTTNGEGVFQLCSGDEIVVIASKSGSLTNNLGTVTGDNVGFRTLLTVEKVWFS